jgi:hypothetical protein
MKKLTIIGLSVVIVVVCVVLLWRHVKISRFDRDFSQKLARVWSWELENMRCTNIVTPNGCFTCLSWFSHPDRTNTYQMAGTWHIKDGSLIETVTSDSNKAARVPRTHSGQIVRVDASEFVVAWHGSTNKSVWQRVSPWFSGGSVR